MADRNFNTIIPINPLQDQLVWLHSSDGDLSSKKAFVFLRTSADALSFPSLIWRVSIPPSHSFIFWRVMPDKMPTDENIRRRGCTLVSICVLYMISSENSVHLFLECLFASHLWTWLGNQLHRPIIIDSVLSTLSLVPACGSNQVRNMFISGIINMFHTIWLTRNSMRFNGLKVSLLAAKAKISTMVTMSGHASNGHCLPLTYDISLLDRFHISPSFCRFKDIEMIIWKPPTHRYIKINTDGSFQNSSAALHLLVQLFV